MTQTDSVSVLCVDDEPEVLEVFTRLLGREPGFVVQSCATAEEALELLNTQFFDVIISDYALPGLDGVGLLKEVRTRGIPTVFIIVTGKRLAHIAIDALNSGADYYLQKGGDSGKDISKLVGFIRTSVGKKQGERALAEWERFYASCVESHTDIICRVLPDGRFTFVNEFSVGFFKKPYEEMLRSDLFSFIPANERAEVLSRLQKLTMAAPDALMEHHITTADGESRLLQWKYHGIFTPAGAVSEYQVSGRDTGGLIKVGHEASRPAVKITEVRPAAPAPVQPAAPPVQLVQPVPPAAAPQAAASRPAVQPAAAKPSPAAGPNADDWKMIVETVNTLDNPVFAVSRTGVVIAWNSALEELTGVRAASMIGRGGREYAVPFYGKPVPMLIDHIISPDEVSGAGTKKVGDTYIGEMEHISIRGKPMLLWGKGTAVYDARGTLIAAIEVLTLGEPQESAAAGPGETYLGGLSSLTLKVSGEGMAGALAGAIGSSTGGYGVYATDRRLFVIRSPDLDIANPQGVQFGTFIMDELFGTTVDTRPRLVQDLEKNQVFVAKKEDITRIDMKRPVLLSGYLTITVKNGGSFRVYIDHKKAFSHVEKILQAFYPEIIRSE
ncbi:MAG TPA: response regulator [Methanoregula sp.]|nr:response regulator [Methanoregula sp.]